MHIYCDILSSLEAQIFNIFPVVVAVVAIAFLPYSATGRRCSLIADHAPPPSPPFSERRRRVMPVLFRQTLIPSRPCVLPTDSRDIDNSPGDMPRKRTGCPRRPTLEDTCAPGQFLVLLQRRSTRQGPLETPTAQPMERRPTIPPKAANVVPFVASRSSSALSQARALDSVGQ